MAWRAVDPLEFYRAHLEKGVRPDGRRPLRSRKITVQPAGLTSVDSSAIVHIGQTTVIAGVQCEPTQPSEAEPGQGRVVMGLEMPSCCSPSFALNPAGSSGSSRLDREKAVLLELLQRTASNGLVNLERLCAMEGVAVWSCYCDMYVLEYDGNLTDACMLAMVAALSKVCLPPVAFDEASGVLSVVEGDETQVFIARPVFPCTFGLLAGSLVMDPCGEEEALMASSFSILLDDSGELIAVHKPGGAPLPEDSLDTACSAARERLPALKDALKV